MSVAASKWAARQKLDTAMAKLVLMALANCADRKSDLAWPSNEHLVEVCRLSERSIRRELSHLRAAGLIEDSGKRRGRTGQIKVWRLRIAEDVLPLARKKRRVKAKARADEPALFDLSKPDTDNGVSAPESRTARTRKPAVCVTRKGKGKDSVTEVTGSSAAEKVDPVKQLFDVGVQLLTDTGVSESNARSTLGKWRKARSDGEILTGLIECRARAISRPVEWLTKRFNGGSGYVSESGFEYRGTREQVQRKAEQRADWPTYWKIEGEKRAEREAAHSEGGV